MKFRIALPFFAPADDVLPAGDEPDPLPAPRPSGAAVTCEFCECVVLRSSGEIKGRLSTKARAMRDAETAVEELQTDLARQRAAHDSEVRALRAELDARPAVKKSRWSDD